MWQWWVSSRLHVPCRMTAIKKHCLAEHNFLLPAFSFQTLMLFPLLSVSCHSIFPFPWVSSMILQGRHQGIVGVHEGNFIYHFVDCFCVLAAIFSKLKYFFILRKLFAVLDVGNECLLHVLVTSILKNLFYQGLLVWLWEYEVYKNLIRSKCNAILRTLF